MIDQNILGPKLEPPRGGLLRLKQAVRQPNSRRSHNRKWQVAGIATGVFVCLVVLSILSLTRGTLQQRQIAHAMHQALTAPPQTRFHNSAYVVLRSHEPNVRILLIASLPGRQPPPATEINPH